LPPTFGVRIRFQDLKFMVEGFLGLVIGCGVWGLSVRVEAKVEGWRLRV